MKQTYQLATRSSFVSDLLHARHRGWSILRVYGHDFDRWRAYRFDDNNPVHPVAGQMGVSGDYPSEMLPPPETRISSSKRLNVTRWPFSYPAGQCALRPNWRAMGADF